MTERIIPVREGEIVTASVSYVGAKGDPILDFEGFKIIVKGAFNWSVGSLLRVRITTIKGSFAFSEVV
jgi:predicted RNA-binding protein with TRAM domain